MTWMSDELLAGVYDIQVTISARADDGDGSIETTSCFGVAENDGRQGRVAIVELRNNWFGENLV